MWELYVNDKLMASFVNYIDAEMLFNRSVISALQDIFEPYKQIHVCQVGGGVVLIYRRERER